MSSTDKCVSGRTPKMSVGEQAGAQGSTMDDCLLVQKVGLMRPMGLMETHVKSPTQSPYYQVFGRGAHWTRIRAMKEHELREHILKHGTIAVKVPWQEKPILIWPDPDTF